MASTNPPQGPSQSLHQNRQAQYNSFLTYTSLGALLLCPALIALPPRKFDFYTVLLLSGTALGGNHVLREYTGRGITDRVPTLRRLVGGSSERGYAADAPVQERAPAGMGAMRGDPATGREGAAIMGVGRRADGRTAGAAMAAPAEGPVVRALREMEGAEGARGQGDEGEQGEEKQAPRQRKSDWKVQRDQREKEALEDGRGYGGLILDQIWEVWNWGRKSGEEEEEQEKGEKK